MNDLDQRVSERLRDDADAFLRSRGRAAMPPRVASRIRRRQTVALTVAIGLAAASAVGAFALVSGIVDRPADRRPGSSPVEMRRATELDQAPIIAEPGYGWRGLWPEVTEPAARLSQQAAETNGSLAWRLDPETTATHYARDVLGWDDFETAGRDESDGVVTVRVARGDAEGPAATDNEYQQSVAVVVERVQGLGVSTIWSVTGLSVPDSSKGDLLASIAVEDLVRRRATELTSLFMQRRVEGSTAAEQLLGPEAARTYHDHTGGLYLYDGRVEDTEFPRHPTLRYGGFDIVSEPRPRGDGTFEAFVTLKVVDADEGDPLAGPSDAPPEILRIGPVNGLLRIISVGRR